MKKFPLIATRGTVVLPGERMVIDIGRAESVNAVKEVMKATSKNHVVISSQKDVLSVEKESYTDVFAYSTLVKIENVEEVGTAGLSISVVGLNRTKIDTVEMGDTIGYHSVFVNIRTESEDEKEFNESASSFALDDKVLRYFNEVKNHSLFDMENTMQKNPWNMPDTVSSILSLDFKSKQELLGAWEIIDRFQLTTNYLYNEFSDSITPTTSGEVDRKIDGDVRKVLDSHQKEFLLREKMKAIKSELGDSASKENEIDEWREQVKNNKYPKEVREKILDEIKKFDAMPAVSAEANVSRSYIEWLLKLPWNTYSEDSSDMEKAIDILESHHYGLEKVKERIIEHLAVKINTKKKTAPIITLIGPPGVGKTSLAKSIAKTVGREMIKVSLGGVKDEAEIRGHRRTYVGAMPGKIIQALNKAKTSNPLILLDEIDKMSADYKGDPTSAMLEVLDPEQNKLFQDHYIELEYDLSQVMFVATANYQEQIPTPLLDRVEIIKLSQYTTEEKIEIAKRFIIPNALEKNGLSKSWLKLDDKVLFYVIQKYTLEAGVRGLQKTIDAIARKLVVKKLRGEYTKAVKINKDKIVELLGKEKISKHVLKGKAEVGYATGMYYSSVGGGVLPVEVAIHPKKNGGIHITGSIKDVMKESMEVAIGYIKSHSKKLGIDFNFEDNAILVHVPEGATPKDGPSAGVAFTTALLSALLNKPVKKEIAMTGEITLRGNVLEIGGLKEKTIGAVEAGVTKIIIPEANIKDIDDLADKVKKNAEIIPVSNYSELINVFFG